jgi:hypothetical protein
VRIAGSAGIRIDQIGVIDHVGNESERPALVAIFRCGKGSPGGAGQGRSQTVDHRHCREGIVDPGRKRPHRNFDELTNGVFEILRLPVTFR